MFVRIIRIFSGMVFCCLALKCEGFRLSLNVNLRTSSNKSVVNKRILQGDRHFSKTDSSERESCCLYSILQMHLLSIFTCCFLTILTFYVYYLM